MQKTNMVPAMAITLENRLCLYWRKKIDKKDGFCKVLENNVTQKKAVA